MLVMNSKVRGVGLLLGTLALFACGEAGDDANDDKAPSHEQSYLLGSVVIDADGNRVSYAQIIHELSGDFSNRNGIEAPGNAVFMARGSDFFYGLSESPEWVRYSTTG